MNSLVNNQTGNGHCPVLTNEILSLFSKEHPPQQILDCTFGRGGHSLSLLKQFPQVCITGLDCDQQAIEHGLLFKEVADGKIKLLKRNFHNFAKSHTKKEIYDLVLMDLGVSSPQLDEKERGFSFYQKGPLDMRFDKSQGFKAADILNSWGKKELVVLFQTLGEIRNPYKIVSDILNHRKRKKFESTFDLVHLIEKHWSHGWGKRHPATPWFLALRMQVNQELEGLKSCLPDFLPLLKGRGCFVVISFHSLEDRIVKRAFRSFSLQGHGRLWNKKVIRPQIWEIQKNPRSRSAKMRVFQKVKGLLKPSHRKAGFISSV